MGQTTFYATATSKTPFHAKMTQYRRMLFFGRVLAICIDSYDLFWRFVLTVIPFDDQSSSLSANFLYPIPSLTLVFDSLPTHAWRKLSICWKLLRTLTRSRRKHSYPSRVQVGRSRIWGHLIIWAGAVRPKTANPQKKKCDGQTDRPADIALGRVA